RRPPPARCPNRLFSQEYSRRTEVRELPPSTGLPPIGAAAWGTFLLQLVVPFVLEYAWRATPVRLLAHCEQWPAYAEKVKKKLIHFGYPAPRGRGVVDNFPYGPCWPGGVGRLRSRQFARYRRRLRRAMKRRARQGRAFP